MLENRDPDRKRERVKRGELAAAQHLGSKVPLWGGGLRLAESRIQKWRSCNY
jgi:hypothetical protein